MRQNSPNPISISIFRGNPRIPASGGSTPDPGEGREGSEGKGKGRESERGREGRGREGNGKVCVIAVGG